MNKYIYIYRYINIYIIYEWMCNTAREIEAATQPLSHSAREAGPATQPLSHSGRAADAATQPLSD